MNSSQHQLFIALTPDQRIHMATKKQLKENWGNFALNFLHRASHGSHNKHNGAPNNDPSSIRWLSLFVKGSGAVTAFRSSPPASQLQVPLHEMGMGWRMCCLLSMRRCIQACCAVGDAQALHTQAAVGFSFKILAKTHQIYQNFPGGCAPRPRLLCQKTKKIASFSSWRPGVASV